MDAASCSAPTAPHMDIASCYAHVVAPTSLPVETYVPKGTTFAYALLPRLLMKHLQHKQFVATYVKKTEKHLQHTLATYVKKTEKHLQHTLAIYVYEHYNICNIQVKHLQHTFKIAETFETYTYNILPPSPKECKSETVS
jgi:hypothetical protein